MTERGDIIDQACELEQRLTAAYVQHARSQRDELAATGTCHYCEQSVDATKKFCDAECRDDWQREQDARRRAGR